MNNIKIIQKENKFINDINIENLYKLPNFNVYPSEKIIQNNKYNNFKETNKVFSLIFIQVRTPLFSNSLRL